MVPNMIFHKICLLYLLLEVVTCYVSYQPEQVHLALGKYGTEMMVTWSTFGNTGDSIVEFGIGGLIERAEGTSTLFIDGGEQKRAQYIHRVLLQKLHPNSTYVYHCGGDLGWSSEFWFTTQPDLANWSPRLAIYGDMGNENAKSLTKLQEETQRGIYDAILHVGDFAYDMDSEEAVVGDQFMRQIESVAAYLPYMVCPGNHEEKYNFSNYRNRFTMPGGTESLWYSFNLGPLHIISFSTEVYYFMQYGIKQLVFQYEWLEKDLMEANQPENRAERPWIITMAHRPMYCSNNGTNDCRHHDTFVRVGLPFFNMFALEPLFYKYGVDVEIWAHEHSYERFWPLYDYKVYNGSEEKPYVNPGAPVHIVTGSAGCKEDNSPFLATPPPWSAFQSTDYGYTKLKAHNASHLYFEQISIDKLGEVIDSFWVVKDEHIPYTTVQVD